VSQWLKANGGPLALAVVGLAVYVVSHVVGLALGIVGVLGFMLTFEPVARRLPYRIVPNSRITITLETVLIGPFSPAAEPRVRLLVHVRILNLGAPAVLHSWALELRGPGGARKGQYLVNDPPPNDFPGIGQLPELGGTTPVGVGTTDGRVSFIVPGFARDELDRALRSGESHTCCLQATDQAGRVWSAGTDLLQLSAGGHISAAPENF
jgi:hypothetical protein